MTDLGRLLASDPCTDDGCTNRQYPCYHGQWTVHGPHHYLVHRQAWRGGGTELLHCPGKTEQTKLG